MTSQWKCPACRRLITGTERHAWLVAVADAVCPHCQFEPLRNAVQIPPPVDPSAPAFERYYQAALQKHGRQDHAEAVVAWLADRDAGYPPHPGLMP